MKKTLLYITASLAMLLTLGGCTRNHGDIGIWFGTWRVVGIAGSAPLTTEGNYFFQFQSKVFRVSQVGGHEQVVESFGTWEEDGDKMTITFPDPDVFYIQMPGLEAQNHFTVTTTSSKEVALTKTDAAGDTYVYRLEKQP